MTVRVDLHTHSTYSDGTSSPADVVRESHRLGVTALLLTDHDSVRGYEEGRVEAERLGLRFGCGVEINTREDDMVHILGYGIDPTSADMVKRLSDFRGRRLQRAKLIIERLSSSGLDISFEDVKCESQDALGRPHIADALMRKKIVRSRKEAFTKYLAKGASAYIAPMGPTAEDAIALVRESGGWSSLAHPFTTAFEGKRIERWVDAGLNAVEAYYMSHTGPQRQRLIDVARRYNLRVTGGSDYHGPRTGREKAGGVEIPDEVFAEIEPHLGLSGA